ncbi:MAG: glycosyltransferase family 39 protein [Desulfomonilia bacterium]
MNDTVYGTGAGHAFIARHISLPVIILILLLQFVAVRDHSLWTPDEPREAEIVREMALSGDYLIPRFAGHPFLEKPPLYYVTAIAAYKVFGAHFQEAGRFASTLFGIATLLTAYFTTRRVHTDDTAELAALILGTFPLFFLASHKILADVGLVFFITAAMCTFILAYKGLFRAGFTVFWLAVACAFLTKGIVGIAIPVMGVLVFTLLQRDFSILKKAKILQGSLVILAVILGWGYVLYARGGYDYLYTFYVYNQVGRFIPAGAIYQGGHVRPFFYYLTNVPVQTLPLSILLVPAFIRARSFSDTERFCCSWILAGLLLLSFASTKREIYFLPMYPAMAIIIAYWMTQSLSRGLLIWEKHLLWGIMALLLLVAIALPIGYVGIMRGDLWKAFALFTALVIVFLFLWERYRTMLPFLTVMCWSMTLILWIPALFSKIDESKSYKQLFTEFGRIVSRKEVIGYKLTETVEALGPFYGGFPVINIEDDCQFINTLKGRQAEYVIMLPSRTDERLYREISSRARLELCWKK